MLNVGPGELVVIFVAALLLLGPKRLPELARGLGKFLREFRRQTDEVRTVVEREFYRMDQELEAQVESPKPALPAPAPAVAAPVVAAPVVAAPVATAPAVDAPAVTPLGESLASAAHPDAAEASALPVIAPVAGTVARPRSIPAPPPPAEPALAPAAEPALASAAEPAAPPTRQE